MKLKGNKTIIYHSFLPFFSLLVLSIRTLFFDFSSYPHFVASSYNLITFCSLIIFIIRMTDFFNILKIDRGIERKAGGVSNLDVRVKVKCGEPGTGKSFSGVNEALIKAEKMWQELEEEYWLMSSLIQSDKCANDFLFKKRWRKVQKGYIHWKDFEGIKCLASNIGIEKDGKKPLELTKEHAMQLRFLPPFTVVFLDECGSMFPNIEGQANKGKNFLAEDFNRFCRHFDFLVIYTEQNPENVPKFIRNVVGENERMRKMSRLYTAKLLLYVCDKIKAWLYDRKKKGRSVLLFNQLYQFAKAVGYIRFTSDVMGNLIFDGFNVDDDRTVYLRCDVPFRYDTQCFSNVYQAKDKEDKANNKRWQTLAVNKNSAIYNSIVAKYEYQKKGSKND